MRLHLTIQRHGLPVTRILWTTTAPSLLGHGVASSSSHGIPSTSTAIASTRAPNASYANGGYTIAQLLEDLNEVVPLETEAGLFDQEASGQWGLEDYAVEVGGSECLHFMEVEGLLRDGDEVVIRALQISDLRARRLSGRHQISGDGKHLIDGVPFGKPYLKRPTSSRPAITIPPRKKRRTVFSSWGRGEDYEEEDTEWAPAEQGYFGPRLSTLLDARRDISGEREEEDYEDDQEDDYEDVHQDAHEDTYEDAYQGVQEDAGDGTVIRHTVETGDAQASESDAELSEFEMEELAEELKGLKEDLESSSFPETGGADDEQTEEPEQLPKVEPSPKQTVPDDSFAPSVINDDRSVGDDTPRRKSVRFQRQAVEESPVPSKSENPDTAEDSNIEEPASSRASASDSSESSLDQTSSSSSDSDSDSDSDDSSSDSSSSDSDDDSTSSSDSDDSVSTSVSEAKPVTKTNPPGQGSQRTKKSNQRNKLRRRLSKLKEIGVLSSQADFATLREWEEQNPNWHPPIEDNSVVGQKRQTKEQEQSEFEVKRQKLLQDLASGGIDIEATSEKENVPPGKGKDQQHTREDSVIVVDAEPQLPDEIATEPAKKPKLDVSSTRRLLFGSLGVRTPRSKEDEEATREKLAGKKSNFQPQKAPEEAPDETEDESELNWEDKLVVKATECIFDDIVLSAPPFPFEQRWDVEAHEIIGQRKGWGKKRRRRRRVQVYEEPGEEHYDNGDESYINGDMELEYDEQGPAGFDYDELEQPYGDVPENMHGVEQGSNEVLEDTPGDLPFLPSDLGSVSDLVESEAKTGSIIAFKQLDMSKATNWQPRISEYLVAEIHHVYDGGILNIRLAQRDRRQKEEDGGEEEENGPRQYSGFEMPGFEDDEAEDDGFREMSFADLMEPKLLRAAKAASRGATKPSLFPAAEEPVPISDPATDEAGIASTKEDHSPPNKGPGSQVQESEVPESETLDSTKSPVKGLQAKDTPGKRSVSPPVKSPEFTGFEPSSHLEADIKSSPKREARNTTPVKAAKNPGDDEESDIGLPEIKAKKKDPQPALHSPLPHDFSDTIYPAVNMDDELEIISIPEIFENFNRYLEDFCGGKNPPPFRFSPEPKKEESSQNPARPQSRSSVSSTVPNPFYKIDKAQVERQQRNPEKTQDKTVNEGIGHTMEPMSMSLESCVASPAAHELPTSAQPQSKQSVTPPHLSPISSIPETNLQPKGEPASQPPEASQLSDIVDLTQSSPPVSPGGSDEDFARSQRLPRGPGWVQKTLPSTRRRTRSSTTPRVQTLHESSISPPPSRRRISRR